MQAADISRRGLLRGAGAAAAAAGFGLAMSGINGAPYISQLGRLRRDGISPEDEDTQGAIANGDDASPAWRSMFNNGLADGIGKFRAEPGQTYHFRSMDPSWPNRANPPAVAVPLGATNVHVDLQGATLMGYDDINSLESGGTGGGFILRTTNPSEPIIVTLANGEINCASATPTQGRQSINGVGFTTAAHFRIENIFFNHGLTEPDARERRVGVGGGDSGILCGGKMLSMLVQFCRFTGCPDNGIYASNGPNSFFKARDCYFYRCSQGIALKDSIGKWDVSFNTAIECDTGFYASGTKDTPQPGWEGIVSHNWVERCQRRPIFFPSAHYTRIFENYVQDWGRSIADGRTPIEIDKAMYAIRFHNTDRGRIYRNTCRMKDWAPSTEETSPHCGIQLTGTSADCDVDDNEFINCHQGINATPKTDGNQFGHQRNIELSGAPIYDRGTNGAISWDPDFLADGEAVTVSVPLRRAVMGDSIDVTFTQNIDGLELRAWVSEPGAVEVRLVNDTGGDRDLEPGELRVRVG